MQNDYSHYRKRGEVLRKVSAPSNHRDLDGVAKHVKLGV